MANKGIKTMKQAAKKVTPLSPGPTSTGATLGKLPNVSAATTVIKRKKPESINAFMARRNKKAGV